MFKSRTSKDFWTTWRNKTPIERQAIHAVEQAREFIIQSLPATKLIAIYIKGSFARREMKKGSDVDMVPIVRLDRDAGAVWAVNDEKIHPVVVVPLSLAELRDNKLHSRPSHKPDLRARPDRFISKLKDCKLIFGQPLNSEKFPGRNEKTTFHDEIEVIKNGYIPAFQKHRISFDPLLKEVFWLVEMEQHMKGISLPHSFARIAASIPDPNHIIHLAYRIRKNGASHNEQRVFVAQLKKYLENLSKPSRISP